MSLSLCFPTPLPDETIYSLFCRYHVRSCNASDNTTIHQLFNKKRSMQTTVFSAFPLKHARHLEESFHGISIESLLQKNTAMPFYRVFKPGTNTSCHSYASDRFLMAMYNNCCTFTKKLRYCPKCAEAQWETFGVSYWQILPQINGYEICHIHKEPIRETTISHSDVRYRFFPASSIILDNDNSSEDTHRLSTIKNHWNQFLQMAEDINFIFRFSYPGFLISERVRNILAHDLVPINHRWQNCIWDDPVLFQCLCMENEDILDEIYEDTYSLISYFQYLPVCLQIRLCYQMFGSVRKVCTLR